MVLGSSLMPSLPQPKLYHPLDAQGRAPYWECPLALNLGSGVSIPGQVTLTPCSCFLTEEDFLDESGGLPGWIWRTSWMDLEDFLDGSAPQHRVHTLSFLVTHPPFLNFVSYPSQCSLLLHPDIWSVFFILTLRPLVGMAPTSLVPLLELTTPPTPNNLPCSSLTEVRLKLSELSRSAPKTNTVNFNGRAHHLLNNSWFSESKADGVTKQFSVKTNSTWFQKP